MSTTEFPNTIGMAGAIFDNDDGAEDDDGNDDVNSNDDDNGNDDDDGTDDDDDDGGNFLWQRQKSDPRGPLWSATGGERVPGSYKEALA